MRSLQSLASDISTDSLAELPQATASSTPPSAAAACRDGFRRPVHGGVGPSLQHTRLHIHLGGQAQRAALLQHDSMHAEPAGAAHRCCSWQRVTSTQRPLPPRASCLPGDAMTRASWASLLWLSTWSR